MNKRERQLKRDIEARFGLKMTDQEFLKNLELTRQRTRKEIDQALDSLVAKGELKTGIDEKGREVFYKPNTLN
jgi:hypothetical protein